MLDKILSHPTASLAIAVLAAATLYSIYRWFSVRGEDIEEEFKLRWSPLEALSVTITVYFWAQFLAAIPLLAIWGQRAVNQETIGIKFATRLAVDIVTLGMVYAFLRRRLAKLADIGLKRPKVQDIGYIFAGYAVYFVTFFLLLKSSKVIPGIDFDQKQELGFTPGAISAQTWLIFAGLVILPAITEEIVTRGFLYTGLRSRLNMVKAGLLTSILFAIAHLQIGSGNALLWTAALDTFTLSMVLVYLREKTGSLVASIGLHMLKNGIAFSLLFLLRVT